MSSAGCMRAVCARTAVRSVVPLPMSPCSAGMAAVTARMTLCPRLVSDSSDGPGDAAISLEAPWRVSRVDLDPLSVPLPRERAETLLPGSVRPSDVVPSTGLACTHSLTDAAVVNQSYSITGRLTGSLTRGGGAMGGVASIGNGEFERVGGTDTSTLLPGVGAGRGGVDCCGDIAAGVDAAEQTTSGGPFFLITSRFVAGNPGCSCTRREAT